MIHNRLLILIIAAAAVAETKRLSSHQKREVPAGICSRNYNSTNKVQCFCVQDNQQEVKTADCYLTKDDIDEKDPEWKSFESLKVVNKLVFTTTRGIRLTYVPTLALETMQFAARIEIKYGKIQIVKSYAFANLSEIEEISLNDNQIEKLEKHAFAHHKALTKISLDSNKIVEINRDVFQDLPSLEYLFLTMNKITTIHDRAFSHLIHLKELDLNKNKIFSLNNETFYGLRHLLRLELSKNALEVIGDNTFLPLKSLQYLNLEGNKIQMLDEKAFNGLGQLQSLSLAVNNLQSIDSARVFDGLTALTALSLRDNKLRELNAEVMAPILNNFYRATSSFDVEDNEFPCECRLDWFLYLKNKTQNEALKLKIENLKCTPNPQLSAAWQKVIDSEKNNGVVFDEQMNQENDYEYYDETQLGGKLFYIDIRDFLNCTPSVFHYSNPDKNTAHPVQKPVRTTSTSTPATTTVKVTTTNNTKAPTTTTMKPHKRTKFESKGILDLSIDDSNEATESAHGRVVMNLQNVNEKKQSFTTTKVSTVSANPIENKMYEAKEMASDEAVPNHLKFQSNVVEETESNQNAYKGRAVSNIISVSIVIPVLLAFRLQF